MSIPTPEKYNVRAPKKRLYSVEAMRFDQGSAKAMAVYQWIEENTGGSFDVNTPTDPIPTSGVSIDAGTGHMVIATKLGIRDVELGDWVVRLTNGEFTTFDDQSFHDTYVKA